MNDLEYEDIFGISEAEGHAQADRANRRQAQALDRAIAHQGRLDTNPRQVCQQCGYPSCACGPDGPDARYEF